MNKQTEALKMAIKAMSIRNRLYGEFDKPLQACKEALEQHEKLHKVKPNEQPAQEPVAKVMDCDIRGVPIITALTHLPFGTKLYTHSAPSWQGLSDDEIVWLCPPFYDEDNLIANEFGFARAIEAKLKEKNGR